MARKRPSFVCSNCGAIFKKWKSECNECGEIDTLVEESELSTTSVKANKGDLVLNEKRFDLGNKELNKLLGGGLLKGSATVFTGEPGNGKSTLFLQLSEKLCEEGLKVSYFSGEENENQIYGRAKRLGMEDIIDGNFTMKFDGELENIIEIMSKDKTDVAFIDSVQTLFSNDINGKPGNKAQIEYCIDHLVTYCKSNGITVIFAGQVTKSGELAGPRSLEHAVDTLVYIKKEEFDGKELRFMKCEKNRFGPTDNVVSAEMKENGLNIITQEEATEMFFNEANIQDGDYGYMFSMVFEGRSPFIVEVQCATSQVISGFPFRRSIGYDLDRLNQVLMVLEKFGEVLSGTNVAINVSGKQGYKDSESLDLAVALAILSAKRKKSFGKSIAYGEIGLRGEIKGVKYQKEIEKQVEKSGFEKIFNKNEYNHIKSII